MLVDDVIYSVASTLYRSAQIRNKKRRQWQCTPLIGCSLLHTHTHTLLCLPDSLFLSGWWHAHSYHDDNHSPGTTKTPNWQWLINYIRKRASSVSIVVARRHLEMLLFSSWAAHLPHASAFFTRTVGALAVFSREGDLQREWKRRKRRQMPLQLHCTSFRL